MLVAMTVLLAFCLAQLSEPASPWPQFRGPGGAGQCREVPPLVESPEQATWSTPLPGKGWSSPILVGPLVWMTTALDEGGDLRALAVDRATGKLIHDVSLFEPSHIEEIHGENSYASPTPCTDGRRVFCHFGRYGTAAVDAASGEVVWRDTTHPVEHQGGPGSSPVLAGGHLILTLDGADESYLVALNPDDGREVWRSGRSGPRRESRITHRAFSTPLVLSPTASGRRENEASEPEESPRHVVVSPGGDQCNAYDAASGRELWHVRYVGFSTVPQPVRLGERLAFTTGFFKPSLLGVDLSQPLSGDVTETAVRWRYNGAVPDIPSPIESLGLIWTTSDRGVLTALDPATGDRVHASRLRGNIAASPIFAAESPTEGLLMVGTKEREFLTVRLNVRSKEDDAKPTATVLARARLDSPLYATAAADDNSLFIRTRDRLWRFDRGDKAAASTR